ncbi:MAG: beta-galactosidase trimerization domain-containing protein [Clostridia bacterium]|nr:beta-galactosidase trimerization domain-containing protein [Clostridia bacterium]
MMTETKKWFSDCYRRNLVDMHIEDWDPIFLSEFVPEDYYRNLKKAHIQAPMLYLQSHVGHCYFPTKVGHMHRCLDGREDLIKRLVSLCRKGGMHPVGYYSLIYNTVEEEKHPEWRLYDRPDGSTPHSRGEGRYGFCCPNNPDYRAFLKAQIAEMAEFFRDENGELMLDGMFYDMTFWPNICHCEHCRSRWAEETGRDPGEMPVNVDWGNPDFVSFVHIRERWMGDFAAFVTNETKRVMPGVSVEHNYAHAVASDSSLIGSSELVNDACDYTGGDLYGTLYNHSFTAKYYYGVTQNQPFEYMTCRCDPSLRVHTVSKSDEHLAVEIMLTAAHHGASFVIDAIDPVGTLNPVVYERLGRVFERQMPYEPYFRGDMIADAGVYYPTTGRYNTQGQGFTAKTCAVNLTTILIEEHIPTAVVSHRTEDLSRYPIICAPQITGLPDGRADALIDYVKNGGTLYFSGAEEPELLKAFFGAELLRYTEENAVYLAPEEAVQGCFGEFTKKYPLPTEYRLPVIRLPEQSGAAILATMVLPYTKPSEARFASIHSNPPGLKTEIPALIEAGYGAGRVGWRAAPVELANYSYAAKQVFVKLFERLLPRKEQMICADAPKQVEIVSFAGNDEILISAVDLLCTEELLPIRDFSVSVKADGAPVSVTRLASSEKPEEVLPFTYENGKINFSVHGLVMFDMFRIGF